MRPLDRELARLQAWIDAGRPRPGAATWRDIAAAGAWGLFLAGVFLYVAVVSGALD